VDGRAARLGSGAFEQHLVKLVIVAQGKLKDDGLRALTDDYLRRLRRHVPCLEIEAKDGLALLRAIPADALLVALTVEGEALSSPELAKRLERWMSQGKGAVAFVIGGAEGLPKEVEQRASQRLSLSRMTLPHRLARVILAEQLYRAISILRGEPYAREG
jgi:23S rRNA (pseudouridine1915-N3)-methyltransferase